MGYNTSITGVKTAQNPSNVTRIVRALAHASPDGTSQIAYYQRGIGSDGDIEDKYLGGATGFGITEHIREAYGFICNNYSPWVQEDMADASKPWDEIVLLGFSRGAFTARAISSLISDVGVLTKTGMEDFWGIIEECRSQRLDFLAKCGAVEHESSPAYDLLLLSHSCGEAALLNLSSTA